MKNKSEYFTIDPVMDAFNAEKQYLYKLDKNMVKVQYGLNGLPIRMLNGEINFSKRSPIVYRNIYYNPTLKTWALKGIDCGFYIEGDYNKRYVPALNGSDGVGFIDTAVKVGTGIWNIGKSLVNKNKTKKAEKKAKAALKRVETTQQNAELQKLTPVTPSILQTTKSTSSEMDLASLDKKLSNVNTNTVMSISALDKQVKNQVNALAKDLGVNLEKIEVDSAKLSDTIKDLSQVSIKSANTSTQSLQKQASIESKTNEVNEALKTESLRNEDFRQSTKKQQTFILISVAAVAVALLYISIRKSNV